MLFDSTYNPFSLVGKTILITGASSGIGRATAIECSKLGAKVIITARNHHRLQETFDVLVGEGHMQIVADLYNDSEIDTLVQSIPEIQGLVNNAGFQEYTPVLFINKHKLEDMLAVNTIAPISLLQKILKAKKLRKLSSIVFTSSLAGVGINAPCNSMYAASKGAISAFVTGAAIDLAPRRIRVNAVCPGMVNTQILSKGSIDSDEIEKDIKNYPLGRYGEPEEIAYAIIYLLSDAAKWVTGTNLIIDGGVSVR